MSLCSARVSISKYMIDHNLIFIHSLYVDKIIQSYRKISLIERIAE